MKRPTHKQNRRGLVLVEAVLLISIIGATLSLCALVLNRAYSVHQMALVSFRESEQLSYWKERFCSDAQQATAANVEAGVKLRQASNQTVSYIAEDNRLIRQVLRQEQLISQETFESLELRDVRWQINSDGRLPLLICELEFTSGERQVDLIKWHTRVGVIISGGIQHER